MSRLATAFCSIVFLVILLAYEGQGAINWAQINTIALARPGSNPETFADTLVAPRVLGSSTNMINWRANWTSNGNSIRLTYIGGLTCYLGILSNNNSLACVGSESVATIYTATSGSTVNLWAFVMTYSSATYYLSPTTNKLERTNRGAIPSDGYWKVYPICPDAYIRTTQSSGDFICTACSPGFGASLQGATSCQPCQPGHYSARPGDLCQPCPAGKIAPSSNTSSCSLCNPGYLPDPSKTLCIGCPAGQFSPDPTTQCATCRPGTISTLGSSLCTPCPAGSVPNATASGCTPCPAGQFSPNSTTACSPCAAASISTALGSTSCTPCAAGWGASLQGATSCMPCPIGTFSGVSGATCNVCPAGTVSNVTGAQSCTPCVPGTFPNADQICQPCYPGTFSPNPATTPWCTRCPPGTSAASAGSTSCQPCSTQDEGWRRGSSDGATDCMLIPLDGLSASVDPWGGVTIGIGGGPIGNFFLPFKESPRLYPTYITDATGQPFISSTFPIGVSFTNNFVDGLAVPLNDNLARMFK